MSHPLWLVFIVWVVGFGLFSILTRTQISRMLLKVGLPVIAGYYILLLPIIMIEESLTIEVPYFWGIVPMLITFSIFFLLLFIIQKLFTAKSMLMVCLCGTLGWVNEFLVVGRIHQMGGLILVIMSILCWLIYAVMEILPATYVQDHYARSQE
jgi:hypothetical protein